MKKKNMKKLFCTALLAASLAGCTAAAQTTGNTDTSLNIQEITDGSQDTQSTATPETGKQNGGQASQNTTAAAKQTLITDGASLFTDRDNAQTANLSEAETYTVKDGENITITKAGVYVIKGEAKNVTIRIEAEDEDKVQIVLDGVTITNDSTPVIYVVNADKVFVTTTDSENKLSVTGTFTADGDTNTDAVIFSKDDLVLNGTGTLTISSTNNGISSHDDLKITGGTYVITSTEDCIEANDSIAISAGTFNLTSSKDAIHCENDEDDTVGYIYISGGSFTIN
ncbi:MAG: carbohydrate-binding domain-containing protein, partial [Solobacterium sp.]|nr:carbohydrate-binding domain-containing protein [Solobacterium sp.]